MSENSINSIVRSVVEDYDVEVFNNQTDKVSDFYIICKNIVNLRTFELINSVMIDMQTANVFVQVWHNINQGTREKMQSFFDKGMAFEDSTIQSVTQLVFKKVWKVL